jgi:signal transduction histidine kinase
MSYDAEGRPERLISMFQDVTERYEFERELRQSREDLKRLSSQLLKLQEEERKRLAREIHDEFGQALTALKIDLFWILSRLRKDQQEIVEKGEAMSALIGSAFQAMRRAITELRPTLLDEVGLPEAVKWKLDEFGKRLALDSQLIVRPKNLKVNPDLAAPLFRIFQECLTNIARHSGATQVLVSLQRRNNEFRMKIADNGRGFDPTARTKSTYGLIGMRERAELIGGRLEVQSEPGKGVAIEVVLRSD